MLLIFVVTEPRCLALDRARVVAAAKALRPLLPSLVVVGGCATGLLVTDPAASPVRETRDIDVIVELASYPSYVGLGHRRHGLGLQEDVTEDAPLCRRVNGAIVLDVMPTDDAALGFGSRWYGSAAARVVSAN